MLLLNFNCCQCRQLVRITVLPDCHYFICLSMRNDTLINFLLFVNVFGNKFSVVRECVWQVFHCCCRYLKTLQEGDLCIGPAVTWLQEKGETFFDDFPEEPACLAETETKDVKFARLWIYSHHIYSKVKSLKLFWLFSDRLFSDALLPEF